MNIPFSGTPARYRRIAIGTTAALVVWLYGGLSAIQYLGYGQTWIFGWRPLFATAVFSVWFPWYFYRSMMRLDARYGAGGSWELVEKTVKLPELRSRAGRR